MRYVLGYGVGILTGVLLQCLHQEMGGPVLGTMVPVTCSPWELGKLCFWPYLAAALLIWRLGDGQDSRGGHCALLVLMPLGMMLACWALGINEPMEIAAAWAVVLALGVTLYALALRRKLWGGELVWYTLAILLGIAYLLLTVLPPAWGPFVPPISVPTMAIPV